MNESPDRRWGRAALASFGVVAVLPASACGHHTEAGAPTATTHPTTVARTTTTSRHATTTTPFTTAAPTTVTTLPTSSPTTGPPVSGPPAVTIWQGPTSRRLVALTFDAGSDAGYASEILDTLASEHVPGTFGVTGLWAQANPSLVRRMAAQGLILNHTYDHRSFTGFSTSTAPLSAAERRWELDRADAAIRADGAPATSPWFRPPYGDQDASVLTDVGADGYRYAVMWSLDSLGWKGLSADAIVARCLDPSAAKPGAIYLFHVGAQSADHAALRRIIDGLRSQGYGFVTVAGLIGA